MNARPTQEVQSGLSKPWFANPGRLLFWALIACGVLLRLLNLGGAGYHKDEAEFVRDAVFPDSFFAVYQNEFARFWHYQHLFLVKFLIRGSVKLIGYAGTFPPEWLARLPFALLGIGALPVFYRLGKADGGRTGGLWALFLATFSVYLVFYSREAYDYGMLMFFGAGSVAWGVLLLRAWFEEKRFAWPLAAGYMVFSWGLLNSHLCGLLFLAVWNALMGLSLLLDRESRRRLIGRPFLWWTLTGGMAYLIFSPFIVSLMSHGLQYGLSKAKPANVFLMIPYTLGPMGWGESLWALVPYIAVLLAGVWAGVWRREGLSRRINVLLALLLVGYFALQAYMLRYNRYEVRYFAPMYPLLLYFVAIGVRAAVDGGVRMAGGLRARGLHAAAALLLLGWLGPSLVCVVLLRNNLIWNYRPVAEWVNQNLPENGIYCLKDMWHLSMLPHVYSTPGRFVTAFPEEQVRLRTTFFLQHPLACSVEFLPVDVLKYDPVGATVEHLPRETLFRHQRMISDPYWERLYRMKTHPLGSVSQLANRYGSHVLICWNTPADLPVLARERGDAFYSYPGTEWGYARDQQMNDWMLLEERGTVVVGNLETNMATATIEMPVGSVPGAGRLTVAVGSGAPRVYDVEGSKVQNLTLADIPLQPGTNTLAFRYMGMVPGQKGRLLLHHVTVKKTVTGNP